MRGTGADDGGPARSFGLYLFLPLLAFAACLALYRPNWRFLRDAGEIDLPAECGPVAVRVPGQPEGPLMLPHPMPFRLHTWDAGSGSDADWSVSIDLRHPPGAPCDYEIFAVDAPKADFIDVRRAQEIRYRHMGCTPGADRVTCRLDGRPWRTYALFPAWRRGDETGLAASVEMIRFHRAAALNVRNRALVQFGWQLAFAALASGLLFLVRPGGPRGAIFAFAPRGVAIALVAGLGGAISGLFFALRPADFGGYDEPRRLAEVAMLVLLVAGAAALFGWLLDWTRRTLVLHRPGVSAPAVLSVLIFAGIGALGLYEAFSDVRKPAVLYHFFSQFKAISYFYLVIAVTLPLVSYADPTWRRHMERGFGSLRPAGTRALSLFALVATGGLLATGVAIVAGGVLHVDNSGQLVGGYYKPAAGLGTWLCSLPLLFSLALAVSLGEERPQAVQDLAALLARFAEEPDGTKRAGFARRAIGLLLREAIPDTALAPLGQSLRSVVEPLNEADLDQIAERSGVSVEVVRARLAEVTRAIEPAAKRTVATPLLLIEDGGGAGRAGRIAVTRARPGSAIAKIAVHLNGVEVMPGAHLHGTVLGIVRAVAAQIGRDQSGANPLLVESIGVELTAPDPGGFRGRSFELPLALALWALATRRAPAAPDWAASGTLDLDSGEVGRVDGVAAKIRALSPGARGAVLFTSEAALADARELLDSEVLVWRMGRQSLRDCAPIRKALRSELRRGSVVVVGVQSFAQAVYLLLGDWP